MEVSTDVCFYNFTVKVLGNDSLEFTQGDTRVRVFIDEDDFPQLFSVIGELVIKKELKKEEKT